MQSVELNQSVEVLQTAISPVALVSGVGLLVLSMTNRFNRTTERARALSTQMHEPQVENPDRIAVQVRILYRRSQILLLAINFALFSVLFVSLLIVLLFSIYLLGLDVRIWVIGLFTLSLICLVVSILLFIRDMSLSLKALHEELRGRI